MGYIAVGYGVGVGVYGGGAPLDWVGGTLYGVPAGVYPETVIQEKRKRDDFDSCSNLKLATCE